MSGVEKAEDAQELRDLIEKHVSETGSQRGRAILERWEETLPLFKKIVPRDEQRMLEAIRRRTSRGMSREQAELEAFYEIGEGEG